MEGSDTKRSLLLDFRRVAQSVSPRSVGSASRRHRLWAFGVLLGSPNWAGCEQGDQSQHVRDGHAPFFCGSKSNFKEAMVWGFLCPFCIRDAVEVLKDREECATRIPHGLECENPTAI